MLMFIWVITHWNASDFLLWLDALSSFGFVCGSWWMKSTYLSLHEFFRDETDVCLRSECCCWRRVDRLMFDPLLLPLPWLRTDEEGDGEVGDDLSAVPSIVVGPIQYAGDKDKLDTIRWKSKECQSPRQTQRLISAQSQFVWNIQRPSKPILGMSHLLLRHLTGEHRYISYKHLLPLTS